MKTKSGVKAGGLTAKHNKTAGKGLQVKTAIKAGGLSANHSETLARGVQQNTPGGRLPICL